MWKLGLSPVLRTPPRSADLSPTGEEIAQLGGPFLLPFGEKVAAKRSDEGTVSLRLQWELRPPSA
jgi:hypothetical protein